MLLKNLLFVMGLLCAACCQAQPALLAVPGTGPPTRLLQALAKQFNSRHAALRIEVPPSIGASGALEAVRSGQAQLARLARPLTDQEQASGLRQIVIAREPIVFAVGAQVTVQGLRREQLAAVFSGRHSDWSDVGGRPAPIRVFYRPEGADTLRIVRNTLPEFATLQFGAQARLLATGDELIEQLQRFGWGIGWSSAGNVRAAQGLRALELDGVAPSAATLRTGQYPLYFDGVLIYRGAALSAPAQAFVDFIVSPEGHAAIKAFGAMPGSGH
jgi:phosphate transport system substrate-binding protein